MVDIENEVFTTIATALRAQFNPIYVSGELNLNPTTFPCAYIEEADNYSNTFSRDTSSNDNHSILMYEVNVFSNKAVGKKAEAKAIFKVIDEVLNKLGFTRQSKSPVSFDDTTYRITGRYTAIANNDYIFRR